MFKINIARWLRREVSATEMQLLRAEDDLSECQFRVKALRGRLERLKSDPRIAPSTNLEVP